MTILRGRPAILIAAVALLLAACAAGEPHVLRPDEFDRDAPTFNRPPADLTEVTLCYSRLGADRDRVAAAAAEACAPFGKDARHRRDGFGDCPLLAPVEAHFECVPR
jgi:hypothetical protein